MEPLAGSGAGLHPVVKRCRLLLFSKSILLVIIVYLCLVPFADAHSGGKDSSGGHNCYVGSCAGTYHYHSGSRRSSSGITFILFLIALGVGGYFLDARRDDKQRKTDGIFQSQQRANNNGKQIEKEDPTQTEHSQDNPSEDDTNDPNLIENWLLKEIDISALQKRFDDEETPDHEWPQWKSFKTLYKGGDTIREFDSPSNYWDSLCGMAGYALIRDGEIIATMITDEN